MARKKTSRRVAQPAAKKSEGVKFRFTFLSNQYFRGQFREEGETLEVSEWEARAYGKRPQIKVEKL